MDPAEAEAGARRMVDEGAGIVDIGGQSTRPGHAEIAPEEEIARVRPILERLAPCPPAPISIDTYRPGVARLALEAGAHIINDEHGFQGDPQMAGVAAEFACPVVLMHCEKGFASAPGDVLERLKRFFARSLEIARRAGVSEERLILDPGIGFHKTQPQNLEILARMSELGSFGLPLLLGVSRKSVIGHVLGGSPGERLREPWRRPFSPSARACRSSGSMTFSPMSGPRGWPRPCWPGPKWLRVFLFSSELPRPGSRSNRPPRQPSGLTAGWRPGDLE